MPATLSRSRKRSLMLAVAAARAEGLSWRRAAAKIGLAASYVRKLAAQARAAGIDVPDPDLPARAAARATERAAAAAQSRREAVQACRDRINRVGELWRAGMRPSEIAPLVGVTDERARQIIRDLRLWGRLGKRTRANRWGRIIEAFGERKTIAEWADDPRCDVSGDTLRTRLDRGDLTAEEAITRPRYRRG